MEDSGLHPNWKALATVHIPYKIFVAEGNVEADVLETKRYEIENVSGPEVQEFYKDVLNTPSVSANCINNIDTPVKPVAARKTRKIPFNQNKFFRAAIGNDVEALKLFDYKNDDINSVDQFGWTALMMAACEGAKDSVECLLSLNIKVDVYDRKGETACSLAEKKGFQNIIKLITDRHKPLRKSINNKASSLKFHKFYCEICDREFKESTRKEHETSTVHRFNMKSEIKRQKRFNNIPKQNRGLKLMVKQGWDQESGLGPKNTGHLYPIKTVIRKQRTGLGVKQDEPKVTHFKPYDLSAIKYKPQPRDKNRHEVQSDQRRERRKEHRLRRELS